MLNFKYIRAAVVAAAFAALTLSSAATPSVMIGNSAQLTGVGGSSESISMSPDPLSSTSTFYGVRPDLRRCVSPMCGGYFVRRVNQPLTRCANGRDRPECYVAEIDWNGQPEVDNDKALLRGSVVARTYGRFGNLGALRVTESWQGANDRKPVGMFYLVRDRGVRCITFPCPTHYEAKLTSTLSRNIAGVDLDGVGAGDVAAALTGPDGVIVAGDHLTVSGPAGSSFELKATQVYVRVRKSISAMKPCIKTGCSSQVCADHDVITTCEFRPEYACYKKAACERQADGNCGFTKTRELTECLGRK